MNPTIRLVVLVTSSATILCAPAYSRTVIEVGSEYEQYFNEDYPDFR